jgi:hypothetical protein
LKALQTLTGAKTPSGVPAHHFNGLSVIINAQQHIFAMSGFINVRPIHILSVGGCRLSSII